MEFMDKLADLGFDVMEVSCAAFANTYTKDEQLISLREHAKEKRLLMTSGYGPTKSQNLSSTDGGVVKSAKDFFVETFRKLELLDIHFLGGGLYSYWPVDYSNPTDKLGDWKRAVVNIREVAKHAEQRGIVLGMEVLNRYEGYLINTCRECLEFISDVNMPNVQVMLDTFHMNIEEDNIAQAIRLAGNKLAHLHVGEQNRLVPGKGSLPWNEIGIALRDIGYEKAAVMEPFVMQGGTIGEEIRVWRDLVEDTSTKALDRDAKGALEYLRHVFK
jgi:D-psicose/D-tagatose/L-ribulose 3-epimerase